jgi:rhodanese-related sulfurtransferase
MSVPEIGVDELARLSSDDVVVIDVRQPEEYNEFHAPGSVLIPLADVPERIDEIPTDGTVYVICLTGARSGRAVEYLLRQDVDAVNVAGGMKAWSEAGHPVATGPEPG